jgi:hypothetical protein
LKWWFCIHSCVFSSSSEAESMSTIVQDNRASDCESFRPYQVETRRTGTVGDVQGLFRRTPRTATKCPELVHGIIGAQDRVWDKV